MQYAILLDKLEISFPLDYWDRLVTLNHDKSLPRSDSDSWKHKYGSVSHAQNWLMHSAAATWFAVYSTVLVAGQVRE